MVLSGYVLAKSLHVRSNMVISRYSPLRDPAALVLSLHLNDRLCLREEKNS